VVTRVGSQNGKYFVQGLLDPLATNPEEIRKEVGLNPNKVQTSWEPYQALQPKFVLQRARVILEPPQSVMLRLENNTLIATGTASQKWIKETSKWAKVIAGINSFQADKLISLEEKELEEEKIFLETNKLLFINGKTQLVEGQEAMLNKLAQTLQEFIEKAELLEKKVNIEIIGQTDSLGTEQTNSNLSKERAEKIMSLLIARGIKSNYLKAKGIGVGNALTNESISHQNNEADRRVTFQVNFLN
jgi:OOP family OmpA-OmpF porin